ncbi:hypothetical protein, partial [Xanthomonas fragariae]
MKITTFANSVNRNASASNPNIQDIGKEASSSVLPSHSDIQPDTPLTILPRRPSRRGSMVSGVSGWMSEW